MRRRPAPTRPQAITRPPTPDAFDAVATSTAAMWRGLTRDSFSFWMICGYIIIEYVRPQSIWPALDFLPWGKLVLVLSALGLLLEKKPRYAVDPANWLMTLYLLVVIASSANAQYPEASWNHWFDFVGWYLIYFLVINIVTTERRFVIFLALFLLASFKLSFFGARTWAMRGFSFTNWGIMGPPGPFANSGELSVQMLMFAPIAFEYSLYLRARASGLSSTALLTLPITAAMTIIGASSRGSQVALAYQAYRSLLKGRLRIRSLIAAVAIAAVAISMLPPEQMNRFRTAGTDGTSQQRLLYWHRGVEMIQEFPTLGVGFYNFAPYFADHYPADMLFGVAQLPHNIFVQVGTDAGLVGLAIFLSLIARNFLCCREIRQIDLSRGSNDVFSSHIAKGLGIALWGFLIAGQFVTITYYPFFWMNLALSVSLLNIVRQRANHEAPTTIARSRHAATAGH